MTTSVFIVARPLVDTCAGIPGSRSAAAPAVTSVPSYLVLHVGGQSRALPIRRLFEVAQPEALKPVRNGASWIVGMVALRGSAVPVVDLAAKLGRDPTPLGESSCVVIAEVECAGRPLRLGLLADGESRVTSARLPRWAVLAVDEFLTSEELRAALAAPREATLVAAPRRFQ